MNPDYTHLTLLVDRSGSMEAIEEDAQGGINTLLTDQFNTPGKITITVTEFDNSVDTVQRMASEPFTYQLKPRGTTALLDAVAQEIRETGRDLAALPEDQRPAKVVFVIVTDGQENASHEHTLHQVRDMILHQTRTYDWVFQFIGAADSAWQGHDLGINTTQYDPTGGSMRATYAAMSASLADYRGGAAAFDMPDRIDDPAPGKTKKPRTK